ncbi:TetR/AcrR family transcriptional regulator [Streptomyces tsukubensis]|uniref:TetR family transcriptional regulator n=1 Tax=Streptomyces tsukubensis TaxID=83656 RepID=A0A1V4A0N4_9ACTN|nr:TetR/AcrR family transcriptional regulator [Streptomyces tsukubensis]OON72059.1 TetR family transcriptional regulator [Streptomyces tsukubensis]QFR93276.1 TetR family transcriptional regulator [Streptomyces tsukubensis]
MAERTDSDTTRRSERSRRAIYDSALELVGETGYGKLTIEAIAAHAGVGKQTIYRWWPSKADVLLEAFLDAAGRAADEGGGAALPDTGDIVADLRTVLRATVDEFNDPVFEAPYRALAAEGIANAGLGAEVTAKILEPRLRLFEQRLSAAAEAGQIASDVDPRMAVELIVAPLAQRWLRRTGPLDHIYADTLIDLALRGIGPRRV